MKKLDDATAVGHQKRLPFRGLKEKVRLLVSDNAAVMKATARLLCFSWFGCFPHTLNLVVKDALQLPEVANILSSVREISSFFKRSHKEGIALHEAQTALKLPHHRMLRDCETRWSSTYIMLNRFLEQVTQYFLIYIPFCII